MLPEAVPVAGRGASDIRQDLALIDRRFALPPVHLDVVTRLAGGGVSPDLAGSEEAGDAEMVHAVAPAAAIVIILLPQGHVATDFTRMLGLAATLGGVVSFSGGLGERCFTAAGVSKANSALQADRSRGVTVIASSRDLGAVSIPCPGNRTAPPRAKG